MVLELSGYVPIGESGIYVSKSPIIERRGSYVLRLDKVLSLRRFTVPSEDDVVDYIKEKADELRKNSKKRVGAETLEGRLKDLPAEVLEEIVMENPERIMFIRSETRAKLLKEGEKRREEVTCRYVLLPYKATDQIRQKEGNIEEEKTFMNPKLLEHGIGHQWFFSVALADGILPNLDMMKTLFSCQVHESKVLEVSLCTYSPEELMGFFRLIYTSAPTREKIEEIKDISNYALYGVSLEPVALMWDMEMARRRKQEELRAQNLLKLAQKDMPN